MSAHNGSGHKRPHTDTGGSRKFLRLTVPSALRTSQLP